MKSRAPYSNRACGYCGGPHPVSDHVAAESPFCNSCLHQRIAARAAAHGEVTVTETRGGIAITSSRHETRGPAPS